MFEVVEEETIVVNKPAPVPSRVTIKATKTAIDSGSGETPTTLTITVFDNRRLGIAGHKVNLFTTNGVLSDVADRPGHCRD